MITPVCGIWGSYFSLISLKWWNLTSSWRRSTRGDGRILLLRGYFMTERANSQGRNLPHPRRLSVSLWRTVLHPVGGLESMELKSSTMTPLWRVSSETSLWTFVRITTETWLSERYVEWVCVCMRLCLSFFSTVTFWPPCVCLSVCTPWYSRSALTFWPLLDFSVPEVCVTFILLVGVGGTLQRDLSPPPRRPPRCPSGSGSAQRQVSILLCWKTASIAHQRRMKA